MQRMIIHSIIWLLLTNAAAAFAAQAPSWKFDPGHCHFYFAVRHVYSVARGQFEDFEGDFRFDPDKPDISRFDFRLKTKSINTNNSRRDRHLKSDDFLHVRRYPEIRFESTRIRRDQGDVFIAEGKLTIKNVTRQIEVPFRFFGSRPNPFNNKELVAGFEAQFTIDRLVYQVGSGKYYELGAVDKTVDILITLEMVRPR